MSAIRSPRAKMVYVKELDALVQEDLLPGLGLQSVTPSDVDTDPTGTPLMPSFHGKDCLGNGEHPGIECCCDECDHYLTCFPDWQAHD